MDLLPSSEPGLCLGTCKAGEVSRRADLPRCLVVMAIAGQRGFVFNLTFVSVLDSPGGPVGDCALVPGSLGHSLQ